MGARVTGMAVTGPGRLDFQSIACGRSTTPGSLSATSH